MYEVLNVTDRLVYNTWIFTSPIAFKAVNGNVFIYCKENKEYMLFPYSTQKHSSGSRLVVVMTNEAVSIFTLDSVRTVSLLKPQVDTWKIPVPTSAILWQKRLIFTPWAYACHSYFLKLIWKMIKIQRKNVAWLEDKTTTLCNYT